jgi:hypothetical protein
MTAVLNEANDAYAAAKETEDRKAALAEAADNLISSLLEYVALVYPEAVEDITNDDIAELTSLLVNEADSLKEIAAMCAAFGDMKVAFGKPNFTLPSGCKDGCACQTGRPHEIKQAPKEAEKAAEDIIAEFLKKNFLS